MLRARDARPAAAGRGRLPAPRHLSLVRAADRLARWRCCSRSTSATPRNPLFLARSRRGPGRVPARHHRQPRDLADAARRCARPARQRAGTCARSGRGSASRAQLDALYQTDRRDRAAAPGRRPAAGDAVRRRCRSPTCARRSARSPRLATAAVAAYRAAIACRARDDPQDSARAGAERLRHAPDATRAEAYRLSLDGWRRLEGTISPGARRALDASHRARPDDPVAHYRFGRVLQARKDDAAALAQFEHDDRAARSCPRRFSATRTSKRRACYERLGQARRGDRLLPHRDVAFGAATDMRAAATRALTRLHARSADRDALRIRRTITLRDQIERDDRRDRDSIAIGRDRASTVARTAAEKLCSAIF